MDWIRRMMGGKIEVDTKKFTDNFFINHIKETQLLRPKTKQVYQRKIEIIQHELFDSPKSFWWIIQHPQETYEAIIQWGSKQKGRSGGPISTSSLKSLSAFIVSLILHHQDIQEYDPELLNKWRTITFRLAQPIIDQYDEQRPSLRQKKAMVSLPQLKDLTQTLPDGSDNKLLLMLYTLIPPARSNYWRVKIVDSHHIPPDNEKINFIILDDVNQLFIRRYKTDTIYHMITLDLPPDLIDQIHLSLEQRPRQYLFTDHTGQPYQKPETWNRWANRRLKGLTGNKYFTLTMFRHLYVSDPNLKLEKMNRKEKKQLAKQMGHSTNTQEQYRWKDQEEKK